MFLFFYSLPECKKKGVFLCVQKKKKKKEQNSVVSCTCMWGLWGDSAAYWQERLFCFPLSLKGRLCSNRIVLCWHSRAVMLEQQRGGSCQWFRYLSLARDLRFMIKMVTLHMNDNELHQWPPSLEYLGIYPRSVRPSTSICRRYAISLRPRYSVSVCRRNAWHMKCPLEYLGT